GRAAIRDMACSASIPRGATACSSRCWAAPTSTSAGWLSCPGRCGGRWSCRRSMRSWCSVTFSAFAPPPAAEMSSTKTQKGGYRMRRYLLTTVTVLAMVAGTGAARADMAAAEKWVDSEFQPSTLTRDEQLAEMEWFIKAAEPFRGMEINVLSETIPTHEYESNTLTKAFEEITGIKVNHQLLGEGEVVQAVQTQMQTQRNLYDAYVNDSDLIGTHSRLQLAVNLTDFMAGEGKDVTLPTLDLDDFIGIKFTTGPDGKLYQLPDQQFANLYWFRADWFARQDLKDRFK